MINGLLIHNRRRLLENIFFSNSFYGLCAVALSIEAMLQQRFPLNGPLYFVLVFLSTILYYTYPYVRKCSFVTSNSRTNWYSRNYNLIYRSQLAITVVLVLSLILFLFQYGHILLRMPLQQWVLVFIFPAIAALYYGINFFNLRKIGWLKPFVIGWIWAGLVTIYPVLFYCIMHEINYSINWVSGLLFLKNMMFIAILCIMFDVKDYATDYFSRLKTFIVRIGLRKTIFWLLFPLSVTGMISFIYYAVSNHFQAGKLLLNTIPFVLLCFVAYSLRRRRSILYYLIIVDGLMLVKAICGILAMSFFD
jgi:hypothetical protein